MSNIQCALKRFFPHATVALKAIALSLAGLAIVLIIGLIMGKTTLVRQVSVVFSIIIIFFLYLSRRGANYAMMCTPSPAAIGLSLVGFFFAIISGSGWSFYGICLGVLAGLFYCLNPVQFVKTLRAEGCAGTMIITGIVFAPLLLIFDKYIWIYCSKLTAFAMSILLAPFFKSTAVAAKAQLLRDKEYKDIVTAFSAIDVHFSRKMVNFVMVIADNNTYMKIIDTMNICNGLFLFAVMMAACAAYNPSPFRYLHAWKLYGFGISFVWFANVVWLSLLYLLLPPLNAVSPDPINVEIKTWMAITINPIYSWLGYTILNLATLMIMYLIFFRPRQKRLQEIA